MKPTVLSLRRQLTALVIVLAVIGLAQVVAGQLILGRFEAQRAALDTGMQANQKLLESMVNAETGLRGYQLTGDRVFLEPYIAGTAAYPAALGQARAAVPQSGVLRSLRRQDDAAQRWMQQYAAPVEAGASRMPRTSVQQRLRGKELFDAYRAANAATAGVLTARQQSIANSFRTRTLSAGVASGVLAMIAVLGALLLAVRTQRLLLTPLGRLHAALRRLMTGDTTVRADPSGPPEIRDLAETLNQTLDQHQQAEQNLRLARDELAEERAYLREILDLIPIAVITCNTDTTIRHRNAAARTINTGPPPIRISDIARITESGAAKPHPLARALDGETLTEEVTIPGPGGNRRALMVDARPIRDESGAITGAMTTAFDTTVLREREAELTAFAGIVAHDLRAPLAAVAGYTELLDGEFPTDETHVDAAAVRPMIKRIGHGVNRMRTLIDDLLAYATARDAPLRHQPVDLNALIEEIVTERTAHLVPTAAIPAITVWPLPPVDADPAMLRQVLDNLIGNAIKYTRPGQPADVTITGHTADDSVQLEIADRGIGIPADQHAHVFVSFHRAHPGREYTGTGLGLAICERIISRHSGTITVEDNPGGGTCFRISVPQTAGTTSQQPALAAAPRT